MFVTSEAVVHTDPSAGKHIVKFLDTCHEKMKKEWGKMLKAKDYETMKNISKNIICPNLISE